MRDDVLVCPMCGKKVQQIDIHGERHPIIAQPAPIAHDKPVVVQKKTSHKRTFLAIAVVVILLILSIAVVFSLQKGGGSSALTVPRIVKVVGTASSSGTGTYVSQVAFTDTYGNTYAASVSDGRFSISLRNPGSYTVQAKWAGAFYWQGGEIYVSPLTINVTAGNVGSILEAVNVSTPDSSVYVTGTAFTISGEAAGQSLQITFSSSNGQSFSTNAINGEYSISLPNDQVYSVQITTSSGQSGYPSTCTAGYINLNVYPGMGTLSEGPISC